MFPKATRFEVMLEAVPDALVGTDQKGVIRFVNGQTELLFGYDRADLIGQPIEMLMPEPLWQIYASHRDDSATDPKTRTSGLDLELNGLHRDGTTFPVNIALSQIDTGDVLLVVTAARETSRRKTAVKHAALISAVVDFSEDAIIGSTLDGVVTSWNPAAERMYGYWSHEIIGRSARILTPQDRVGEFFDNLARVSGGEVVQRLETMRTRKNGTVFPVSLTLSPILDEDGVVVGASAIHRDVTEQRRAFELAQRMEAIVESSQDAVIGQTLDGVVTNWNRAAERMYGYTCDEIIGQPIDLLMPEDRRCEMQANLTWIRAGRRVETYETIRVRKDGTRFPISLTLSPIRDPAGAAIGASGIGRDLTEQEHAARYARSLIEADLDPMVTISPSGKVDDVNEATVKITGFPRQALLGTDFSHYFTDPDKAHEGYQRAFEKGSLTDYPLTLVHQDGTLTDVLYNASVYRDGCGTVLGVLAAARDASKLRDQQQLSAQLQEALKSRVIIEQAKGITAQRHGITIDEAYQRIRAHTRNNHASLHAVAEAIVGVGLQV